MFCIACLLPCLPALHTASSCWTEISSRCWYLHRAIDGNLNICLKLGVELNKFYTSYFSARWNACSVPNRSHGESRKKPEKDPEWLWTLFWTLLMWCLKRLTSTSSNQLCGQHKVASYNLIFSCLEATTVGFPFFFSPSSPWSQGILTPECVLILGNILWKNVDEEKQNLRGCE